MRSNDEVFYKIGITKQTINARFRGSRVPYKVTLISCMEDDAGVIFDLETKIQNSLKEYSYEPKQTFGGNTECFISADIVKDSFLKLCNI